VTRLLVTPTAFNTILWRVVAMRPDGSYDEGFVSLFDGNRPLRLDRFGTAPAPQAAQSLPGAQRLTAFSQGFTHVRERDGLAVVTDLRMGQEPNYTFSFVVGQQQGGAWRALTPRSQGSRGNVRTGLAWVWTRMWGVDIPPPR
jgi:inner membrane protein